MTNFSPRNPSGPPNFERRPPKPTLHPRKVVGGFKLSYRPVGIPGSPSDGSAAQDALALRALGASLQQAADVHALSSPESQPLTQSAQPSEPHAPARANPASGWTWVSARWMRLAEDHAPNDQLIEGLEYARLGQTRSLDIKPGLISARVQGRIPTAYKTEIRLPTFSHEHWAGVIASMSSQARFGASLLSGELPNSIEDLFAPLGLRLLPASEHDLATTCSCDVFKGKDAFTGLPRPGGPTRWCRHVCCVMYLIAEKLAKSPLTAFSLRGLDEQELLEQLRQQRALAGLARVGSGAAPVYVQHVAPRPELAKPLQELLRDKNLNAFWTGDEAARNSLEQLELPIQRPDLSHPLLRRLGPSPFKDAKFPLVGLLATCYEVAGEAALHDDPPAPPLDPPHDQQTPP